jgi:hypothetical protein
LADKEVKMVKTVYIRYSTKDKTGRYRENYSKYILPKKMQNASHQEIKTYIHDMIKHWKRSNILHDVDFGAKHRK